MPNPPMYQISIHSLKLLMPNLHPLVWNAREIKNTATMYTTRLEKFDGCDKPHELIKIFVH